MPTNDYLSASAFSVTIDGISDSEKFESVSGVGASLEDIPVQTDNDRALENRPGRFNAQDVTLVRRFKGSKSLYDWFKSAKDGKINTKSGSIILANDEGGEVVRFNFFDAWPKSWLGPSMTKSAAGNDVLTETVVLSVKDIEMA